MRPGTLFCLVLVKWFELLFLTLLTVFMMVACASLIQKLEGQAPHIMVLSVITCVLAGFNLFYNNLAMNLRFKVKSDCYSIGHLVYDIPNMLMCNACCNLVCRDKFVCNPGTYIKWAFKTVWLIAVIATIKSWKAENEWVNSFDWRTESMTNRFDDLLIVYLLQHLIFIVLRPSFLCCFMCCTCLHDHGKPYEKEDSLNHSIISFKYISYMQQRQNGLVDRPLGFGELAKIRQLE